jgi:hypothetical protein
MKECFKCGERKRLNEFYKHPQMGDGHLNKCKECTKIDTTANRNKNIKYYRQYDLERMHAPNRTKARKIYQQTKAGKDVKKRASKKWSELNKSKKRTHLKVKRAIMAGKLIRKPCKICKNEKSQAHHPDYSKPLSVIWLCSWCHAAEHKRLRRISKNVSTI